MLFSPSMETASSAIKSDKVEKEKKWKISFPFSFQSFLWGIRKMFRKKRYAGCLGSQNVLESSSMVFSSFIGEKKKLEKLSARQSSPLSRFKA